MALGVCVPPLVVGLDDQFAAQLGHYAGWRGTLISGTFGCAAGLVIGTVVGMLWLLGSGRWWPRFAPAGLFAAVTTVLGWQHGRQVSFGLETAAASMLLLAMAAAALRRVKSPVIVPLAAIVLVACLPRLLDLDARLWIPFHWPPRSAALIAAGCAAMIVASSFVAGWLAPPPYFSIVPANPPSTESAVPPPEHGPEL
jgi:hypothetical protein